MRRGSVMDSKGVDRSQRRGERIEARVCKDSKEGEDRS